MLILALALALAHPFEGVLAAPLVTLKHVILLHFCEEASNAHFRTMLAFYCRMPQAFGKNVQLDRARERKPASQSPCIMFNKPTHVASSGA
jgi:hypothetical protein